MPRLSRRLAFTWYVLPSLAVVLACVGACKSFQAILPSESIPPPVARTIATGTPGQTGAISPVASSVSDLTSPSAISGLLIYAEPGTDQPIWVSQGKGKPRVVANANWFRLSPDGHSIALIRGFPQELWIASSDDSDEKLLYTAPNGDPLIDRLLWSPDGTMIVFSLTGPGSPASQDPGALWRLEVATGAVQQLLGQGAHWPLFSPNSRWLSLASPLGTLASHGTVGLIDVEGQGKPAIFELVNVWDRTWAADSSGFVVALEDSSPAPTATELWWIPIEGVPVRTGQLANVAELFWQPGGERLVYRKGYDIGTNQLYLANYDGSEELPIPGSEGMSPVRGPFPSWSSDGRWLLMENMEGAFFLLDTNNRHLHPLDAQGVYGWLDAGDYLASIISGEDSGCSEGGNDLFIDVYRCTPLGPCEWLAQVPRLASVSYASR